MWKKENLRKNFLRVKQIADQNLGRSEKSEVLSEDLLTIEKRVETVKQVCLNITKKLTASLQAQGDSVEKRLKKLPETSLAHCLNESSTILGTGTESLLGTICQLCGEAQNNLAREQLQYEINIERDVLFPLQAIFDNDLPAILKARKHLTKTTLDMDSAKGRHTAAVRQSQLPGTNMAAASAKADQIKEELEEAEAKVDYVKDNLAIEMSNFIAKETEHSQKLLALVEAQAAYHKKALEAIQAVIPRMQHAIDNNPTKPVFGKPLEEHLRVTGRDVAVVLEACAVTLIYTGMNEEGLFRIAGAASKLKKLKACFDANIVDMEEFRHDPHTIAGTLKQYLRELPEPLLTYQYYEEFMEAAALPKDKLVSALKKIIDSLPTANYNNFRYLIKFLDKLAKNSDVNKMTPSNISIVIAPNLLWSPNEVAPNMLTTGNLSTIIEAILSNTEYFFPEDLDFTKTSKGSAPPRTKEKTENSTPVSERQDGRSPSQSSVASRRSSNRNSRLDFYNAHICHANSLNSAGDSGHRSASISESSDIPLEGNLSYDNISLDDSLSASEGDNSSNIGRRQSNSTINHLSNQSPVKYVRSLSGSSSPRSRSVPPAQVAKSFHSDVYSTVTALQSLGAGSGSWSDYFNKVSAVRDETFHHTPPQNTISGNPASREATPPLSHTADSQNQGTNVVEGSKGDTLVPTLTKDIEFIAEDIVPSSSPVQTRSEPKLMEPEGVLASNINNVMNLPTQHVTPVPVTPISIAPQAPVTPNINYDTVNLTVQDLSPEQGGTSPRVQRRMGKKPAPPPPPDRPYSVAVTASVNKPSSNLYQTWPRHQAAPLASPEGGSGLEQEGDKPSIPDRPQPPLRPTGSHHERPERPKAPPPSVPQGHNRSASTGGMVVQPQPQLTLQMMEGSTNGGQDIEVERHKFDPENENSKL